METTNQDFNISNLEQISGVKAHTIRIWERRYSILSPKRTISNSRIYDIEDLKKILNLSLLNNQGYKISRLAKLSDDEMVKMVQEVDGMESLKKRAINNLKVAVINFDTSLFHQAYEDLAKIITPSQIFQEIFIPLMEKKGILWSTIPKDPVRLNFLFTVLKGKLYQHLALLENEEGWFNEALYILFLPKSEIDELGLLFLNYELKLRNLRTILLTSGPPMRDLDILMERHTNAIFVSYLGTKSKNETLEFLEEFEREISRGCHKQLLLCGAPVAQAGLPPNIKIFESITEIVVALD